MNKDDFFCASSDFLELERVRTFVIAKASTFGLSDEDSSKLALAVDEACTNLIKHAFNMDKKKEICISVEKHKKKIVVNILDNGAPFDPRSVKRPVIEEYLKDYKRGGLGIHLMLSVMDDIEYYPSNKRRKQNILKLIKNIN